MFGTCARMLRWPRSQVLRAGHLEEVEVAPVVLAQPPPAGDAAGVAEVVQEAGRPEARLPPQRLLLNKRVARKLQVAPELQAKAIPLPKALREGVAVGVGEDSDLVLPVGH